VNYAKEKKNISISNNKKQQAVKEKLQAKNDREREKVSCIYYVQHQLIVIIIELHDRRV
jgi:hypothetical protein